MSELLTVWMLLYRLLSSLNGHTQYICDQGRELSFGFRAGGLLWAEFCASVCF